MVVCAVFKVFPPRQASTTSSFSLERISERNVEQIVDIPGGGLQDFRPGHGSSSSSHVPARGHEAPDGPGEVVFFFRTFPQNKESAKLGLHSSPRVHASVSSSTPAPQFCPRLFNWVMILTDQGPYFLNRRTGETRWQMEDGYRASWWLRPDGRCVRLGDGDIFETLDGHVTWLWVRPCDQAATSFSSWVVVPVVVQRQVSAHGLWLSRGSSSSPSPRRLLEECLFLRLLALILSDHVSGSLSSVSGCCLWNTDHWILRGDDLVFGRNAWLDSGFWPATVLGFWTNYTHFPRRCGLGFGRFCLRSHAEWRSMLSRCFDLSPCTRCSPLEYGHYFYESMCWNLLDDEGYFPRSVCIFRTRPLKVESLVVIPINLDDLWPCTSHLRARVQKTNTTTTTQQHYNNTTLHNNTTTIQHYNTTTQQHNIPASVVDEPFQWFL